MPVTFRQPMKPCSPRSTMMGLLISFITKCSVSPAPGDSGCEWGHPLGATHWVAALPFVTHLPPGRLAAPDPLPAVSMEAASCPFFFAVTYLPLAARRVMRLSHHSMSK